MGHRGTASAKAALYSRITILSSRWQRSCAVVVCSQLTVAMRGYGGERMHALHVCMHASRAADYGYSMMTTMCAHQPITGGVAIGCARKGNRRKAGRGVWEGLVMPVCPLPVGETTKRRVERVCIHWFLATLSHVSHFWCPCRSQSRPASTRDRIFTTTAAHTRGHAGSVTSRGEVPYGGAEDSQQHERRIHNRALRWGAWGESDRRQGRRAYSAHSGRCRRTVAICAPCAIRADHVGAVRLRGVSDACDLVVRVKASPGHVLGGQANRERMVTRPRKDVHTFKVYPAEPWLHLRKPV